MYVRVYIVCIRTSMCIYMETYLCTLCLYNVLVCVGARVHNQLNALVGGVAFNAAWRLPFQSLISLADSKPKCGRKSEADPVTCAPYLALNVGRKSF